MIYDLLIKHGVARPPFPIKGRIPNFIGAEKAAERLLNISGFRDSNTVKINPDSPQRPVRYLALRMGKKVVMPTPRIKKGFLILDPKGIRNLRYASTIRGAFTVGQIIHPSSLPEIDFIVEGSVAVSPDGYRLGKGEGYAELEYAILLEYGKIDRDIEIATTIHPLQIVDKLPQDEYDVTVDYIVTPDKIYRCSGFHRPEGILWDKIPHEKIMEIPILEELYRIRRG